MSNRGVRGLRISNILLLMWPLSACRLVKKVYIPLPDPVARKALIRHLLSSQKHGLRVSTDDQESQSVIPFTSVISQPVLYNVRSSITTVALVVICHRTRS